MSLSVTCPDCDKTLKVKDELAGKKVRCPGCSTVIKVPSGSADELDDVEFLDDVEDDAPPKRRRRPAARDEDIEDYEDYEDYDGEPVRRPRSRKPAKKKSSRKSSSSGVNGAMMAGLIGVGVGVVLLVIALIVNGTKNNASTAHWPTFKHPLGVAQIDMPGAPTFNAAESKDGAQTYSLTQKNYRLSITGFKYDANVLQVVAMNPAAYDLMFAEIEKNVPIQKPGARILSSQRIQAGSVRGIELKVAAQGMTNHVRFYAFPTAMVAVEFITRNESAYAADRDRFFASLRGPDGSFVNGGGGATPAPPAAHGMPTSQAVPPP